MRFGTLLASILLVKLTSIVEVHSTVSITADPAEGNVVQCNSNVTLTCYTPSNTNTMTWYRNSTRIAFCRAGHCLDENTLPNYYATFDNAAGKFDVAIRPANNNDSNVQFQCDDGNNSTRFILLVTGDYSTDVSWSQLPANKTKLECVTGCVNSSTEVQFSWSLENVNNTKDVKTLTTEFIKFSNETECLFDQNCGGSGRKKYISSVTITEDNNQTNSYYILVKIIFVGFPEYSTVVKISDRQFRVKVENTVVSDGRLPLPCYGYTIILSVFSVASVIISQARRWKYAHIVVFVILLLPHVVVTVLASVCNDNSCLDRCLPCWTHCLLLTVILLVAIPITAVLNSSQILKPSLSRRCVSLLGVFVTIGAFTAVILSSVLCIAKANSDYTNTSIMQEKRTEQSWIYGLILGVMWLISDVVALVLAFRPNARKGLWKRWEKVYIICNNVCITFGVVSVILTGYFTDYIDDGKLGMKHWEIYLLVTWCIQGLHIIVVLIPVFREPVHELEVIKKSMKVQLQWKCRWGKFKTFFYKLENKEVMQGPVEARCSTTTNRYDLLQCTVDKLKLDTDYTVCIYSKIWKIPCETKQLKFKTKAPPKPENFRIKKKDTSVTLNWNKPPGTETAVAYEVVYGRTDWPNEWISVDIRNKTTCTIEGLMPETNYTIKLYAIYPSGKSDALVKEVLTKASKPNPPSNFRCIKIGGDYVILQWSPCQEIMKQKFRLTYFSTESKDKKWIEYDGSERIEYTVKRLHPGTEYMFDLATKVGKKTSESSPVLVITTEGIKPAFAFECTGKTESDLTFTWAPSPNVLTQRFRLSYATSQTKWMKDIEHDGSKKVTYTVGDLEPGTEYTISLVSVVGTKLSQTSPSIIEKTKGIKKKLEAEYKYSTEMANTMDGLLPDTEYRFTLAATTGKTNSDNNPEMLIKTKGRVRRPAKIADLTSIPTGETT